MFYFRRNQFWRHEETVRTPKTTTWLTFSIPLTNCAATGLLAQSLQTVSVSNPAQASPAGGSGDSWAPIVSADGRYVLFASAADNLVSGTNDSSLTARLPPALNVYLRDRTNRTRQRYQGSECCRAAAQGGHGTPKSRLQGGAPGAC